ncbi:TRAP transporter small permease subunit [Marinobacterium rhizophilum]|uniref:TRAP transporter small permease protein n=1 Tax=Marinobacterium rhizophilum TaxID=420402 RepID=A0ABY5HGB7_9GAMM|nr:TRAP transporter small permease subunit [Marinobacterium rhizophilum]UTW11288.1 TRAP transporter small permease subunit [Marinobacterium rhizophilum]
MTLVRIADTIDDLNRLIGSLLKWGLLLVVLLTAATAILRYAFNTGYPWLSEIGVWLNAMVFTLGAGWVLLEGGHVRVDLFYGRLGERGRAWVNLIGTLSLLYPMLLVLALKSWPSIQRSWLQLEHSPTIDGLPFMYLLKSCILGFCLLLALQGLSLMCRSLLVLQSTKVGAYQHV